MIKTLELVQYWNEMESKEYESYPLRVTNDVPNVFFLSPSVYLSSIYLSIHYLPIYYPSIYYLPIYLLSIYLLVNLVTKY